MTITIIHQNGDVDQATWPNANVQAPTIEDMLLCEAGANFMVRQDWAASTFSGPMHLQAVAIAVGFYAPAH